MNLFVRLLIVLVVFIATVVISLLVTEWRPAPQEITTHTVEAKGTVLPDTFTIVSWNIGYGGLGDDMDFFYEGGEQSRTTEQRTEQNLERIISWLKSVDGADFILLQEVDRNSKRSYCIDQYRRIAEALPNYHVAWAYNYISPFVPIPLNDPIGHVEAGVMTLSKYPIMNSVRYQYPSIKPLPTRLFDLKRCMLTCEISLSDGGVLYINNTHNSAFNTPQSRNKEIKSIYNIISSQQSSVTGGDWNATPPGYTPSEKALNDPYFQPLPLCLDDIPPGHTVASDIAVPSMRYLNNVYNSESSTNCVIDFFVVSNTFKIVNCQTVNLDFKNSDHNPLQIIVKKVL